MIYSTYRRVSLLSTHFVSRYLTPSNCSLISLKREELIKIVFTGLLFYVMEFCFNFCWCCIIQRFRKNQLSSTLQNFIFVRIAINVAIAGPRVLRALIKYYHTRHETCRSGPSCVKTLFPGLAHANTLLNTLRFYLMKKIIFATL